MISGVFNVTYYMYQYGGWSNSTQTIEFFFVSKKAFGKTKDKLKRIYMKITSCYFNPV